MISPLFESVFKYGGIGTLFQEPKQLQPCLYIPKCAPTLSYPVKGCAAIEVGTMARCFLTISPVFTETL